MKDKSFSFTQYAIPLYNPSEAHFLQRFTRFLIPYWKWESSFDLNQNQTETLED